MYLCIRIQMYSVQNLMGDDVKRVSSCLGSDSHE